MWQNFTYIEIRPSIKGKAMFIIVFRLYGSWFPPVYRILFTRRWGYQRAPPSSLLPGFRILLAHSVWSLYLAAVASFFVMEESSFWFLEFPGQKECFVRHQNQDEWEDSNPGSIQSCGPLLSQWLQVLLCWSHCTNLILLGPLYFVFLHLAHSLACRLSFRFWVLHLRHRLSNSVLVKSM